jgi:hypothetical protein
LNYFHTDGFSGVINFISVSKIVVYRLNDEGISVKNLGCEIAGFHAGVVEVFTSCSSLGF